MTLDTTSQDFLDARIGAFPEARLVGLGIGDPTLSQYRASWNSQSPSWRTQMGALFLSQTDMWVLAALTALPAPLAIYRVGYVGPNPPPLPQFDELWYDDQHETWKRWNGTSWQTQSGVTSGVASINGQTGVATITAAGLNAVPTSSLGVTGGVATLDSTGHVPASQSRVTSVAGRFGAVTLTVADVTGAVPTSSINISGGIAGLDATGHLPVGVMPAGYGTGGTGGVSTVNGQAGVVVLTAANVSAVSTSAVGVSGGVAPLDATGKVPSSYLPSSSSPVTTVAGRTGAIVLAVTDVTNAASVDPTTGRLTIGLAPQRLALHAVQGGTATVANFTPGGRAIAYGGPVTYAVVAASRPPLGSAATIVGRVKSHATQLWSTLVTTTLPANQRRVVTTLSATVTAGDAFYAGTSAVGSTEPGGDFQLQILGYGSPTPPALLNAPNPVSGLVATGIGSVTRNLSWSTPATGGGPVSTYHIYRADALNPFAWLTDVEAPTTTYTDSPVVSGTSYTYSVVASNDDKASTLVSYTAAASGVNLLPQANGAIDSSKFFVSKGTGGTGGTGPVTPTVSANRVRASSGNQGANAVADRIIIRDIADSTAKTSGEIQMLFQFNDNNCYTEWYISTNDYDPASGGTATSYLRCQLSANGWTLTSRTPAGTFTTHANALWATGLTPGVDYGFRFVADTIAGDGSQVIRVYQMSSAVFLANPTAAAQIGSGTVPAATRSLIPAGHMLFEQLGTQGATTPAVQWTDHGVMTFLAGTS